MNVGVDGIEESQENLPLNKRNDFIKVISADNHEFLVDRETAMGSKTIKTMLSGSFQESEGIVRFPEINTPILERVMQYLHYRRKHLASTTPIPEFDVSSEEALELIMAANFLDC